MMFAIVRSKQMNKTHHILNLYTIMTRSTIATLFVSLLFAAAFFTLCTMNIHLCASEGVRVLYVFFLLFTIFNFSSLYVRCTYHLIHLDCRMRSAVMNVCELSKWIFFIQNNGFMSEWIQRK